MNRNTKTSNFLEAIKKYANRQKEIIEEDAQRFRDEKIEQATEEGLEDAYLLLQKEISSRKNQIVTEYASKEISARIELFEIRNRMIKELRDEAEKKLTSFVKTEEYAEKLISYAKEIDSLFDGAPCVVYLSLSDFDKSDALKDVIHNAEIKTDDSIRLGGVKAYCAKKGIIADSTYDARLDDAMKHFIETSGLEVV